MASSLKARFISMVLKLYLFMFCHNLYYILFRELFKHDVLKTEGAESQDQVQELIWQKRQARPRFKMRLAFNSQELLMILWGRVLGKELFH